MASLSNLTTQPLRASRLPRVVFRRTLRCHCHACGNDFRVTEKLRDEACNQDQTGYGPGLWCPLGCQREYGERGNLDPPTVEVLD